jgi:hypothetical protein
LSNCPHKAHLFPCHGGQSFLTTLAPVDQSSKSARQALLGSLGDGSNSGHHPLSTSVNPRRGAGPKNTPSSRDDKTRFAALRALLAVDRLERVIELLHVNEEDMPPFLNFLRTGGGTFQKLRQAVQARGRSDPVARAYPPTGESTPLRANVVSNDASATVVKDEWSKANEQSASAEAEEVHAEHEKRPPTDGWHFEPSVAWFRIRRFVRTFLTFGRYFAKSHRISKQKKE